MATILKIIFNATKNEIKHFWQPMVFELQPAGSDVIEQYAITDFKRYVKDESDTRVCFIEIKDLKEGRYTLRALDFHTGHPLIEDPNLEIKGTVVDYTLQSSSMRPRAVNEYAMDLIIDAPYRLEQSYPYVPIVVYIKDIKPGEIKIKSIEFRNYSPSEGVEFDRLPPESIFRVLDRDGKMLHQSGKPLILQFDAGEDYETIMTDPWYRLILLRRNHLKVYQSKHLSYGDVHYLQYMVNVEYKSFLNHSKQFVFRTLVPDTNLPRINGWYNGDTHYHSEFTDNPYEYGGPLSATAEVAKAVGLSWVTVTDHSYGLSRPRTQMEELQKNRWQTYGKAIKETNERYKDILLVRAEEITVKKFISGLHLLSFNNPFVEDRHIAGFGSLTMEEALDKIQKNSDGMQGFIYAAHPSSKGYTWEDDDYRTATKSEYNNLFKGLQIFNEKIMYARTTGTLEDEVNPFVLLKEKHRRDSWSKELVEGIKTHWVEKLLIPSLKTFVQNGTLRKFYVIAGSDAHMDFNYAFRPHPAFFIHSLYDNAFGKVRTLAYLPDKNGKSLTEHNLYEALGSGKTLLTDGPLALFRVRYNGIEYQLGDTVSLAHGGDVELQFEWQSTPEFGPIHEIKLIKGTTQGEKVITDQFEFADLHNDEVGFGDQFSHVLSNLSQMPCYLRLEASSGIVNETGEALYRCITNPIWVIAE